jgi:hypothetical protein
MKLMADFFDKHLQEATTTTLISGSAIVDKPFSIRPWMILMVAIVGATVSVTSILFFFLKRAEPKRPAET